MGIAPTHRPTTQRELDTKLSFCLRAGIIDGFAGARDASRDMTEKLPAELYREWDEVRSRRQQMQAEYGLIWENVDGRDINRSEKRLTNDVVEEYIRLTREEERLRRAYQEALNDRV